MIAMGTAITAGKRDFECIVAIGGDNSDIIYSPCGNCRQMLMDYWPGCSGLHLPSMPLGDRLIYSK